ESLPCTAFGFGVPLGSWAVGVAEGCDAPVCVAGDCGLVPTAGDGEAPGDAPGDCCGAAAGVSIGLAGAGAFCASAVTVSSMARSIGMRATPLFLSTQA